MIARIQQTIALFILAGLTSWIWHILPDISRIYMPFLAVVFVYIAYLAILFIVIHHLNRNDPEARASLWELMLACLREAITAPRVILWRQPFRTHAIADHVPSPSPDHLPDQVAEFLPAFGKPGVVFIHGFFCNRAFWSPWMRQLLSDNRAFVSVSLEPVFGSIDDYAPMVEAAVAKVTRSTGHAPTLICHSMGGLATRAWLRANPSNDGRIQRIITIGTPHFGTVLSTKKALLPFTNTQQMQRLGAWTQQLAKDEPTSRYGKFTCWYSNCDNIVVPTSTAMLPGADNRLVTAQGHISMAFNQRIMRESLVLLG
jgi:pimeloyl-ACP methyl ester carboxylesterase